VSPHILPLTTCIHQGKRSTLWLTLCYGALLYNSLCAYSLLVDMDTLTQERQQSQPHYHSGMVLSYTSLCGPCLLVLSSRFSIEMVQRTSSAYRVSPKFTSPESPLAHPRAVWPIFCQRFQLQMLPLLVFRRYVILFPRFGNLLTDTSASIPLRARVVRFCKRKEP
jgi:hypothetical protein